MVDGCTYYCWLADAIESVPVEVSLNGNLDEFTSNSIQYTYLPEPHLKTIFPIAGPTDGGTLIELGVKAPAVFNNASDLQCIFDGNTSTLPADLNAGSGEDGSGSGEAFGASGTVPATWDRERRLIYCYTPQQSYPGRVEVTLSFVIDGYTLNSGDGVVYTFYPPAILERVWPDTGPTTGYTDIAIQGTGYAGGIGPFYCRFGHVESYLLRSSCEASLYDASLRHGLPV